jgi:hypothetical protein
MEEIQALLERFESWTAACVNREANMIAYTLAKEAKNFASENTWIEMVHSFIEELLLKNVTFSHE